MKSISSGIDTSRGGINDEGTEENDGEEEGSLIGGDSSGK